MSQVLKERAFVLRSVLSCPCAFFWGVCDFACGGLLHVSCWFGRRRSMLLAVFCFKHEDEVSTSLS